MRLTPSEIDLCSEELGQKLSTMGVTRRNIMHIRLTSEETLIRMKDHFGEDAEVAVDVFKNFSGAFVRIAHVGPAFNPLKQSGEEAALNAWGESLFSSVGLRPQYAYSNGTNVLRLPFPRATLSPAVSLLLGIVVGLVVGVLGDAIIPEEAQTLTAGLFFAPIFNVWTRMLNALAAPVVFLMVLTTLLNMRGIKKSGGDNRIITLRYFTRSYLLSAVAVLTSVLVFGTDVERDPLSAQLVGTVFESLTEVVPNNIVDPFITSNTPQLLLIAFLLAAALSALDEQVREAVRVVRQCNMASLLITKWVSNLVPLVTGLMIALEIWRDTPGMLIHMWKPLLLAVCISVAFLVIELVSLSAGYGLSLPSLVRKVWQPFWVTLIKGNLDDSYGDAEHSCIGGLGIDRKFTELALPQGLVMYMPASFMGTLVFTVLAGMQEGLEITLMWLLAAVVLDVVLFVATPPVPGANLLAFITLFGVLGVPDTVLLDAMVFDILFGLFANAANQTLLQMELVRQADRLGLLNVETLQADRS